MNGNSVSNSQTDSGMHALHVSTYVVITIHYGFGHVCRYLICEVFYGGVF